MSLTFGLKMWYICQNLSIMKNIFLYIYLLTIFIAPGQGYAVTPRPGITLFQQPDGTFLSLILKGDERLHLGYTTDGYAVLPLAGQGYNYALADAAGNLVRSGILAHDLKERSASEITFLQDIRKNLFFSPAQVRERQSRLAASTRAPLSGTFPTTGIRKMLMILANFSNTQTTFSQSNFNNYMNQVNYNGTGSFRDYYLEVSRNLLTVNTTVTVWVTLPNTHDYYGPEARWGEFARDAVLAAEAQGQVDFSEYDNNLDGMVDGVAIIHQGRGQEESGNPLDIWSHSWQISAAGFNVVLDGVVVDSYTTMPEKGNAVSMGTIGVMCHEFGHNLGAPDFYDTDYTAGGEYDGTGYWDLMAAGSWNGINAAGDKPAHHIAWTKWLFGWISPVTINTGTYTLQNPALNAQCYRFNTTTPNEYFLCENRQLTGFDAALPGHGMLIYHVDGSYVSLHTGANNINATSHQGLYPESATSTTANGIMTSSGSTINTSGCPWPGTSYKTTFTDATTPNAKSWAGANTGLPITNISENSTTGVITFCVNGCTSPLDPQTFTAVSAGPFQINLAWTKNSSADPVMIAWSSTPAFGTPVNGTSYLTGSSLPGGGTIIYSGSGNSFSHTGLGPNTTWYYRIFSLLPGNQYSPGTTTYASTGCGIMNVLPLIQDFEANQSTPACWTEENSMPAWEYITGGFGGIPAAAHSGAFNARLSDNTATSNTNKLISPVLNLSSFSGVTLSFWHTQARWQPDQDELRVYYRTTSGGAWVLLASYTASITSWTSRTLNLPNLSATYQVAFEGDAQYGHGVCIDDIAIRAEGNWIGGTPGNPDIWGVASNWDDGLVPSATTDVYVTSRPYQPVVNATGNCRNLTIESGAAINVTTGIQLNVNGNIIKK